MDYLKKAIEDVIAEEQHELSLFFDFQKTMVSIVFLGCDGLIPGPELPQFYVNNFFVCDYMIWKIVMAKESKRGSELDFKPFDMFLLPIIKSECNGTIDSDAKDILDLWSYMQSLKSKSYESVDMFHQEILREIVLTECSSGDVVQRFFVEKNEFQQNLKKYGVYVNTNKCLQESINAEPDNRSLLIAFISTIFVCAMNILGRLSYSEGIEILFRFFIFIEGESIIDQLALCDDISEPCKKAIEEYNGLDKEKLLAVMKFLFNIENNGLDFNTVERDIFRITQFLYWGAISNAVNNVDYTTCIRLLYGNLDTPPSDSEKDICQDDENFYFLLQCLF